MPLLWHYVTCYINMFTYRRHNSRARIVIYLWTNISSIDRTHATIGISEHTRLRGIRIRDSRNPETRLNCRTTREKKDTIELVIVDWRTRLFALELAGNGSQLRSCAIQSAPSVGLKSELTSLAELTTPVYLFTTHGRDYENISIKSAIAEGFTHAHREAANGVNYNSINLTNCEHGE